MQPSNHHTYHEIKSQTNAWAQAIELVCEAALPEAGLYEQVVFTGCGSTYYPLDFFYTNYPDDQIKRIILSGGGANLAEFRQLLASEASTVVETLNPLKKFTVDEKAFDPEFIRQIAPQAAIAMGLAMRKVDDK